MSRALLNLFIAFCFLARGYEANPVEEEPCQDADTCATLNEVKAEAYAEIHRIVGAGLAQLNKIEDESANIKQEVLGSKSQVDKMLVADWYKIFENGNKAVEEAIKQGKDQPVFECIIDCELEARKLMPQVSDKCNRQLVSLWNESEPKVVVPVNKAKNIETKLLAQQDAAVTAIKSAITKISVSWSLNKAKNEFAASAKEGEKVMQEMSAIVSDVRKVTATALENCGKSFQKVRDDAKNCASGCLQ